MRARAEIAEHRELLRVTLSSIGDAVIATDEQGRVTYLNPVAEELTAWHASEAVGKPLEDIFHIVNEETRRIVEHPAVRVLREGHVVGLANHTVLIARDGRERAIDDSAAPIRNATGQLMGVILVFRDVTERRVAARRLAVQTSELRRTNDELSQFAYAISHDLREPLRNIVNFSQLLVQHPGDRSDAEATTFAKLIVEGVQRMESLLNDLLTYAQIDAQQEHPPGLIDANEIVGTVLENLRISIAEAGAKITSDDLPSVPGYEAQLTQVFQNLVSNSIKYRSGNAPRVHIGARKNGNEWIFSVRDNGIGIEPQHHKQIFGVFKRLHGKNIPGTGIGLAICSKVVERHGGRIWVDSRAGEGATFFFSLPSIVAQSPEPGYETTAGQIRRSSAPHAQS